MLNLTAFLVSYGVFHIHKNSTYICRYVPKQQNICTMIKRTVSFYLQKIYNETNNGECQIRMRVRWNGCAVQFNCGYTIDARKWNPGTSRCRKNVFNQKGFSSADINKELNRLEGLVDEVFKAYEVRDVNPSKDDLKRDFNILNGKDIGAPEKARTLDSYMDEFTSTMGSINSWAEGTYKKINTLRRHLSKFSPSLKLSDFDNDALSSFIEYLRDRAGMQNTSIIKTWRNLHWFLKWAHSKGYLSNTDFQKFGPKLKTVSDKEVIYLTWDELMLVYNFKFPEGKKYLERTRDVFCFQCFTSLRYSDVAKLRREDIEGDIVKVVTEKTGNTIRIELNKYSRSILEKYQEDERPLPVPCNQRMNKWIKEVCFLAGIDQPMTLVYYKGAERIEEVHPKYELIGTHTGRRTFICNALTMGIPAATVMEWTGHSDYKAMKPYIKIADQEKAKAMKKFDER